MTVVLVVLDANVLVADPFCSALPWRVLANTALAWDISLALPRVALLEVRAAVERRMDAVATDAQKWQRKARPLGIDHGDSIVDLVAAAATAFPSALDAQLVDLHIEVVDPPDVPHMDLVARASSRRRPCDENGDGYRDTLIWLTLIDLAKGTDDAVMFVSDNYKDFGATGQHDDRSLHPHLTEDLEEAGLSGRVTWFRRLDELVLSVAAEKSTTPTDDLRSVGDQLARDSVIQYITDQVLPGLAGRILDPDSCGLPLSAVSGWIAGSPSVNPEDIQLTAAESSSGESLVGFAFPAAAAIEIEEQPGLGSLPDETRGGEPVSLLKTLRFAGLVVRDHFHRPTSAEVTEITAPDDDPGVAARRLRSRAGATLDPASIAAVVAAMQKNLQPSQATLDAIRAMQSNLQPSQAALDAIRAMQSNLQPSQATLDAIRATLNNLQPSQATLDAIRATLNNLQPSQATLDAIRAIQRNLAGSGLYDQIKRSHDAKGGEEQDTTGDRDDQDDSNADGESEPPEPPDESS